MSKILKPLALAYSVFKKIRKRCLRIIFASMFQECGDKVVFDPDDSFSYSKIKLGDDIFIGSGACFATITEIRIDSHVMFGPNVTIRGGNHNTELSGVPMSQIKQKRDFDDLPIHIQTDVWIGCGVIILKGVTIGRGAVVGAGSVVTKDIPAYAIAVGVPARVISSRGDEAAIQLHEKLLYPDSQTKTGP